MPLLPFKNLFCIHKAAPFAFLQKGPLLFFVGFGIHPTCSALLAMITKRWASSPTQVLRVITWSSE